MTGQALRRSQFITTYGPGAILEGKYGPRMIPTIEGSGLFKQYDIHDFEITDSRLSTALLDGASIVRLPSNAELGLPDAREAYQTTSFPSWSLCTIHHILYQKRPDTPQLQACPKCKPHFDASKAWQQAHRQAIRFVMVCPDGHLDDVNWPGIIKHTKENCRPEFLLWKGNGSSLRNINICCSRCKGYINLGHAYAQEWNCSGRFPETSGSGKREGCDQKASIIQRGAANIRMSEIYSALTIPPADTHLHRLLQLGPLRTLLAISTISSKQELLDKVDRLVKNHLLGPGRAIELSQFSEKDILQAIAQIASQSLPQDNQTLRLQEFEALRKAAVSGAAAVPSSIKSAPPQFEVVQSDIKEFPLVKDKNVVVRVTPVSRLRVVMVQKGYRRVDPLQGNVVDIVHEDDGGTRWYPGVELYGEGIFIDLPDVTKHFPLQHTHHWIQAWRNPENYHQRLSTEEERDYLHPVFVWWHTLAHRLINALSIDSGYSSAAVRERIYVDINEETGEARGGILLYTAQPGGDGTLGGLIALVSQFDRVLRVALNTIHTCSNDPLCGEVEFDDGKYNGSACYACLLISETSCEHRNTRLDRTLLAENLP